MIARLLIITVAAANEKSIETFLLRKVTFLTGEKVSTLFLFAFGITGK